MSTPVDLNFEILTLILRVNVLRELTTEVGLPWTLEDLALLDSAVQSLRTVRDHALEHVRADGYSWGAISAATGVPATTWRGRLDRHTRGVEQS